MISTSEIRTKFLTFFGARQHEIVASSSLVPANDKTLLFTNAGMVQFKDVFLGLDKRNYIRATSSQRCVRAGGKHNDLENVGYTARHHTFFEMLGNFSFGDYFKEDAILYAWEFLTKELSLPKEKLWVTVFEEDDEAYELWLNKVGIPEQRLSRIGAKDNFWQMGETGPCGPCSEIFFDHGPDVAGGPPGTPDEDGDRYIEIWNLVFMQFNRAVDGSLTPLPKPSVDTGMGLERVAAVLQNVHNNYSIDLFKNLIASTAKILNSNDLESNSLKVIADHIRSCAFLIIDGVLPSNEGRGYVLRRIIRRAARHGHKLGAIEPFFYKLVTSLVNEMADAYPELIRFCGKIEKTLLAEERKFNTTLSSGMKILDEDLAALSGNVIPGKVLFKLYDTFGFPIDLTADIARERGLEIDQKGFDLAMQGQRERARSSNQFIADMSSAISTENATGFVGYESLTSESKVTDLYVDGIAVDTIKAGEEGNVIMDETPFYGESGGQVGDTGLLLNDNFEFHVKDTQKKGGVVIHCGVLTQGEMPLGQVVKASVDVARRKKIVQNHSATHLLHAALRKFLGGQVEQKGSLVAPSYLRFDFSHDAPLSTDKLRQIERWVNEQISANSASTVQQMSMQDAIDAGAVALFGEKYGEVVRVVSLGEESTELCGGTHVNCTGDIGFFRINSENGVASGIRRIEAVSGLDALDAAVADRNRLYELARMLKTSEKHLTDKLAQLLEGSKRQTKELATLQSRFAIQIGDKALEQVTEIADTKLLCLKLEAVEGKALREMADRYKSKLGEGVVVLASVTNGKILLVVGVTQSLTKKIKAGDLVNELARKVGGKGGGRSDMAMAGGTKLDGLDDALAKIPSWIKEKLI